MRRAKAGVALLRAEWDQRAAAFREHDAEFTSPEFWRRYLRMETAEGGLTEPDHDGAQGEPEDRLVPEMALG